MRKLAIGSAIAAGVTFIATAASASSGLETPENGAYQVGRGGAWLARADDPLAVYFNPAGLVRQSSGVHVGAHLMFLSRCFTRAGQNSDEDSDRYGQYTDADGKPYAVSPRGDDLLNFPIEAKGNAVPANPTVCEKTHPSPNPQLAANIRILNQLAI